jgi:hypothetical protein
MTETVYRTSRSATTSLSAQVCHNRLFGSHPVIPVSEHPFGALGRVLRDIAIDCQGK